VTVVVRAAAADDAGPIVEASVRAWEEGFRGIVPARIDPRLAWDVDRLRARLADPDPDSASAVVELDGRVIGYIVFGAGRDRDARPRIGEIWALYVHPAAWRRGLGRRLVEHALTELRRAGYRRATLWTLAESAAAKAFYEGCGFKTDGATQRRAALGNPLEIRYGIDLPASRWRRSM
jgi:ribosomal protein S18 acetylase RimI-like enzyme